MIESNISVICVSNNEEQVKTELIPSLNFQKVNFELIILDNKDNRFSSAAEALNYGVSISKGDILIFSHQDITLKTDEELEKFSSCIEKTKIGDIVGTQGVVEKDKRLYSNLTGGKPITMSIVNDYLDDIYEVTCVDEGLFGMKRETWKQHHFNEELCDNWHLYCVEVCLYARLNGHKVYVSPIQVHHSSMGHISIGYMNNLKRLCKTYRRNFRYIWTTCYKVRTNPLYINGLIVLWKCNRILHGRSLN